MSKHYSRANVITNTSEIWIWDIWIKRALIHIAQLQRNLQKHLNFCNYQALLGFPQLHWKLPSPINLPVKIYCNYLEISISDMFYNIEFFSSISFAAFESNTINAFSFYLCLSEYIRQSNLGKILGSVTIDFFHNSYLWNTTVLNSNLKSVVTWVKCTSMIMLFLIFIMLESCH